MLVILPWAPVIGIGAVITLALAICSFLGGLVVGTFVAATRMFAPLPFSQVAFFYCAVLRSIPELLVIYLLFFGGSQAAQSVVRLFGFVGYFELSAFVVGVFSLSLVSGSFAAEYIRGAWSGVPRGQFEAANALGLSRYRSFRHVVLPQLLRIALPSLENLWLTTLKETSIVSIVGLVETMRQAALAGGSTGEPFAFYLAAAGIFLCISLASRQGFGWLEQKTRLVER